MSAVPRRLRKPRPVTVIRMPYALSAETAARIKHQWQVARRNPVAVVGRDVDVFTVPGGPPRVASLLTEDDVYRAIVAYERRTGRPIGWRQ